MLLQTKDLQFVIDENGTGAGFIITGKEGAAVRTSDVIDCGVFSAKKRLTGLFQYGSSVVDNWRTFIG